MASMSLAASTASAVASMATVSSHDIHAQIEAVAAVRIGPRVRMAVMTVRTNDALYPLVGLLGRLAVVWSVTSCSRGPSSQTEAVDAVMEATHRSMWRENVGLPPSDLRRSQTVGVASPMAKILALVSGGARSMDVLSRHVLVVQADNVPVVSADVSLNHLKSDI